MGPHSPQPPVVALRLGHLATHVPLNTSSAVLLHAVGLGWAVIGMSVCVACGSDGRAVGGLCVACLLACLHTYLQREACLQREASLRRRNVAASKTAQLSAGRPEPNTTWEKGLAHHRLQSACCAWRRQGTWPHTLC